ncbi:hypothetical protein PRUB_a0613 [Pseudoalteromonas rubra]|uniref:Uncharacterized protein n=1 Tax=Pseudoalteromonas rubra TaxID=43658 RepID=A0A8T0C686_9GAMM|nr:hypothetical protein PRUB_a0613 [Pseudoalteromonas rubra]
MRELKRLTNLFKIQADNELTACQSATNTSSLFIRFWQHTFNVSWEVKSSTLFVTAFKPDVPCLKAVSH